MIQLQIRILLATSLLLLTVSLANARGTVKDYRFFSTSLNKEMSCRVYLPEAYDATNPDKKFPILFFLHGASAGYESYDALYLVLDNLIGIGLIKPVITVMPDGLAPPYNGSFYTNSELYGEFEDFISVDLVNFADSAFHTFGERGKRGIMGASMGAYGALKAAFRHPELYIGVAGHSGPVNTSMFDMFIPDLINEDGGSSPFHWSPGSGKSLTNLTFTMAGAFSPNLNNEYLVDFPLDSLAVPIPSVMERWSKENICEIAKANPPRSTLGIRLDCGNADEYYLYHQNRAFADTLTKYGIPHVYEEYAGTHTSGLPVRVGLSLLYFDLLFKTDFTGSPLLPNPMYWDVYPNPATTGLTISSSHSIAQNTSWIKIIDPAGRIALLQEITAGSQTVDVSDLPPGLYFYKIRSGNFVQNGKTMIIR